jgi:hypothetical protein
MMALWGLAVLFSWTGLGTLIARIARLQRGVRIDWGLRTAWGMSLTLAIGGVLMVFHLANLLALQALVLVGLVLWGYDFYIVLKGPRELRLRAGHRFRKWRLWLLPLMVIGALVYLGNIVNLKNNWWDDMPAYMAFITKFLATGTVIEPFSWRRLSTYGGQELLQAQIQSQGTELNINMVDQALSRLVILGLVVGMFQGKRGRRSKVLMLLLGLVVLTIDAPWANSQSLLSAVAMFLALMRTLELQHPGQQHVWGIVILAGSVAAGVSTFRMNLVPAAGMVLGLSFAGQAIGDRGRWRVYVGRGAVALLVMGVLLAPWMMALWESSRSLFYPLMHGNQRPEFHVLAPAQGVGVAIRSMAGFVVYGPMWLLLTPLLLVVEKRYWRAALPLALASVLGSLAVAATLPSAFYYSLYRYSFPVLFAATLAALALGGRVRGGRRGRVRWVAAIMWCGLILTIYLPYTVRHQAELARMAVLPQVRLYSFAPPKMVEEYRAIQDLVPAGEAIYSIVNVPTIFDFGRNPIYTADHVGIASPDPGIPAGRGRPEEVLSYFQKLDIKYIVAAHFDSAQAPYYRPHDRDVTEHPELHPEEDGPGKVVAAVSVRMEDIIDTLATPDRLLASGPSIRLIYVGRLPLPGRPAATAGPGPSPPPP